jgi:uncharacterized protein (UPF0333 family)
MFSIQECADGDGAVKNAALSNASYTCTSPDPVNITLSVTYNVKSTPDEVTCFNTKTVIIKCE